MLGIGLCLFGIAICGKAGVLRDKTFKGNVESSGHEEFNISKGILVAIIAGMMSSCFAFGIASGEYLRNFTVISGATELWQNGPLFIIIMAGGFTTNGLWCGFLIWRNKSFTNYSDVETPLNRNYIMAALAGILWYSQFMFYGMGSSKIGDHDYASWTLHMAFIIIFSSLIGILTYEWRGSGKRTLAYLALGLLVLLISTVIVGIGNSI